LFEQAITIGETVDNLFVIGVAEVSLTTLHAAVGDPGAALRTFDRLIRHWDGRNDWTHQWTILQNVAPLLTRSGSPVEAAVLVGALTRTEQHHRSSVTPPTGSAVSKPISRPDSASPPSNGTELAARLSPDGRSSRSHSP
jgi:hypothetical protein